MTQTRKGKGRDMNSPDKQKIIGIMKKASGFAFLATGDGDQPRVRPVTPIVEDDMSIWVATSAESRKVKQIKQNPKISLAFVQHPEGEKAATVIGEAEIVADMEQRKRIWELAPYDLSQYFPNGPESEDYCLLKISVGKIEWWEDFESGKKTYKP
jgi:general stress protein 26